MSFTRVSILSSALMLTLSTTSVHSEERSSLSPYVNKKGEITLPVDFRMNMAHLGSWFVPEGAASGFHDVYTNQQGITSYRKDKVFEDGTIIIKELRADTKGNYTTGAGVHYSTESVKQWFVMIKDSKGHFPDNKNWGNGWGWALFKTENPTKNVSTDYKVDCLGCHAPAAKNDWIYTEGYPTLSNW